MLLQSLKLFLNAFKTFQYPVTINRKPPNKHPHLHKINISIVYSAEKHLPEHICECMPSISPRSGGSGCPRWPRIAAELCGHACMRRPLLVASCWLVWLVAAATTFLARRTINGNSRIASQHGNRQREPRIEYGKKKKRGNRFGKSDSARVPKNVLNGTPRLKETTRNSFFFLLTSLPC